MHIHIKVCKRLRLFSSGFKLDKKGEVLSLPKKFGLEFQVYLYSIHFHFSLNLKNKEKFVYYKGEGWGIAELKSGQIVC